MDIFIAQFLFITDITELHRNKFFFMVIVKMQFT